MQNCVDLTMRLSSGNHLKAPCSTKHLPQLYSHKPEQRFGKRKWKILRDLHINKYKIETLFCSLRFFYFFYYFREEQKVYRFENAEAGKDFFFVQTQNSKERQ